MIILNTFEIDGLTIQTIWQLAPLFLILIGGYGIMVGAVLFLTRPKDTTHYAYKQPNTTNRRSKWFSALPRVFGRFVGKVGLYQVYGRTSNSASTEADILSVGGDIDRHINPIGYAGTAGAVGDDYIYESRAASDWLRQQRMLDGSGRDSTK